MVPAGTGEAERLDRDAIVAELRRRSPFDRMEPAHVAWAAERMCPERHAAGAVLLPPGADPDRLRVIRSGAVDMEAMGNLDPAERSLGTLGPGDAFPLEALHESRPIFSTFRALEDTVTLALGREDFRALQALSAPFLRFCEKRAERFLRSWRRVHQVHLAQMDSVVNPVSTQRSGLRELGAAIRRARSREVLARASQGIELLARDMLRQGVAAAQLTRMVSTLHDRVAERAIELEVEQADLQGIDFCWIALGSEGRMEQTLLTDQDNGIVFDPGGRNPEELRARLLPVARAINASLAASGAPLCKGEVMAGNPAWCLSVDEWRQRFSRWLDEPQPAALLNAAIFFDLRGVYGNQELARTLRAWLCQAVPRNRRFLALLTRNALERQPPLGLFRDFVVEADGEHRGTFDLKQEAASVFVEAARILALAAGSSATGTEARLRDAGDRTGVERRETQAWIEAFHFVQALRLKLQCEQADRGGAPHNRVDPGELNALDRRFLVEALRQAQKLQKRLARVHGAEAAGL